jgi:hypothetical protein
MVQHRRTIEHPAEGAAHAFVAQLLHGRPHELNRASSLAISIHSSCASARLGGSTSSTT